METRAFPPGYTVAKREGKQVKSNPKLNNGVILNNNFAPIILDAQMLPRRITASEDQCQPPCVPNHPHRLWAAFTFPYNSRVKPRSATHLQHLQAQLLLFFNPSRACNSHRSGVCRRRERMLYQWYPPFPS